MISEKHHKIAGFLKDEFNKLKVAGNDKKIISNFYKQRRHKDKIVKLLSKIEDFLHKVDSLDGTTVEEIKNLQYEIEVINVN